MIDGCLPSQQRSTRVRLRARAVGLRRATQGHTRTPRGQARRAALDRGVKPGWCTAWLKDFDTAGLTFSHPAGRASFADPIQFGLAVLVTDQDPRALATQIIESMRNIDPKSTAKMLGGSR